MKPIAAVPVFGAVIVLGWFGFASRMGSSYKETHPSDPVYHDPFDPTKKDLEIRFHEGRVQRDPGGAIGWSMLSGAYLARARESDSYADAVKAERAARRSLALRTRGNLGGQTRLVNSLLQQHRFADALTQIQIARKIWGPEPSIHQLYTDILIEIGRYDEATVAIEAQPSAFEDPSGLAVRAHLAMIDVKPDEALDHLKKAYAKLNANSGASQENLAWFEEKTGEAFLSLSRYEEAEKSLRRALDLYPRGYKAYANLTRLAARREDWAAVIELGEKSNAIAPMVDILALVGDAYGKTGKAKEAQKRYEQIVALAGKPGGAADDLHEFAAASGGHGHSLDRQYAMFCADHNRDLDSAYACAIRDLQGRRDVYGFDTLAWVSFKKGDLKEAAMAMDKALARGTREPSMLTHAAIIYRAAGDEAKAARYLDMLKGAR